MTMDDEVVSAINNLWVLVAGIICFFLQAGFGLLEVGSVRGKNAINIVLKNLVDAAVGALSYWAVGYAFAYGEGGNPFIGHSFFFLMGTTDYIMWFFQMVFASTTATIVSGAVAERCRFRAYLVYSFFLTAFIYPVVSHWIWSPDGFLYGRVLDFSGSGAVHLVGGAAAMSGSIFVGPRLGKFVKGENGKMKAVEIPGHNAVLAALGGFILWMGFFAFNGAACGAFFCPDYETTGRIVVVTTLAGATGCLTLLFFGVFYYGTWDLKLAMNGLLSGMVATCSGCNVYETWISVFVGIIGAFAYFVQDWLFENVLRIDDPLGASAVHMGAGAAGLLMVGFFANPSFTDSADQAGVCYGGNGKQLGWQIVAMIVYFVWAFGTCSVIFFTLRHFNILRVSEEVERMGMDQHHHGTSAYPRPSVGLQSIKETGPTKLCESGSEPAGDEAYLVEEGNTLEETPTPASEMRASGRIRHRRTSVTFPVQSGAV